MNSKSWTTARLFTIGILMVAGCDQPVSTTDSRATSSSTDRTVAADSTDGQRSTPQTGPAVAGRSATDQANNAATSPSAGDAAPASGDATASPSEDESATTQNVAPEKYREPLFEGWSKPDLALFITGRQDGYIEPCGCTGLANQKGGMARRRTLQKQLLDKGWELVPIDVGNQIRRFGEQAAIKMQVTSDALRTMNYRAIGFGPDDLRLTAGNLYSIVSGEDESKSAYLGANTAIIDESFTKKYQIVTAGGKKIGITSVLGNEELQRVTNSEIVLKPADKALGDVWPKLQQENCDLYVLLVQGTVDESTQLAQKYPHFQIVITSGGGGEPKLVPDKIPNSPSLLIQVGKKAMYVGVLGIFGDEMKFQRVPLDDRFGDAPEMLQLLESYQDHLKTLGLAQLGLKPVKHPSGYTFVGSEKCGECHTIAYTIWKDTPHVRATEDLVHPGERSHIPRHFDPECLSCHVTGWNPQKYFPYESGYLSLEESKHLHGSGCENCHGPGSRHVAAEQGDIEVEDDMLTALRLEMRLPLDKAELKCLECHDLDNSPDFHREDAFAEYWKKVEHVGKD